MAHRATPGGGWRRRTGSAACHRVEDVRTDCRRRPSAIVSDPDRNPPPPRCASWPLTSSMMAAPQTGTRPTAGTTGQAERGDDRKTASFTVGRPGRTVRIGVISDTHGLLRPEALEELRKVDLLIHAGDVGNAEVLDGLRKVARAFVVRGNNDEGSWAKTLPDAVSVEVGETKLYVLHELSRLDFDPVAAGFSVVVSGHSHRPSVVRRDGILYLNPGSAGPRRFTLPITVATLSVSGRRIRARIVELDGALTRSAAGASRGTPRRPRGSPRSPAPGRRGLDRAPRAPGRARRPSR